jgi:hypothetical protein
VRTIARVFRVSPVTAAMRFIELTPHAYAIVYSVRGAVRWSKASRAFPSRIQPDAHVPNGSLARAFFDSHVIADVASRRAWLPTSRHISDRTEIVEHAMVIPEPGWGGVLSLLWIPNLSEPCRTVKKFASTMCTS